MARLLLARITESGTSYKVKGSHTYSTNGSHTVATTVVEADTSEMVVHAAGVSSMALAASTPASSTNQPVAVQQPTTTTGDTPQLDTGSVDQLLGADAGSRTNYSLLGHPTTASNAAVDDLFALG